MYAGMISSIIFEHLSIWHYFKR